MADYPEERVASQGMLTSVFGDSDAVEYKRRRKQISVAPSRRPGSSYTDKAQREAEPTDESYPARGSSRRRAQRIVRPPRTSEAVAADNAVIDSIRAKKLAGRGEPPSPTA